MNHEQFQQAAGISATLATRWFLHITSAMEEFGITSANDKAMFIAQVGHESSGFSLLTESLNYTPQDLITTFGRRITQYQAEMLGRTAEHAANQSAIANLVYSGRLGNKAPGDGWKYRGRGLIQITGLDNYLRCSTGLHLDLVKEPELLESYSEAARSAAWFYSTSGCSQACDDVNKVTRIINGGSNGLSDRKRRLTRARAVLTA